jgi:hypothetical protein
MIMFSKSKDWKQLFLFCLGLAVAASFAMKWLEADMFYAGKRISIIGLEMFYGERQIEQIFGGLDPLTRKVIGYQLYFDFYFMAGCFPGIACLCMLAAEKVRTGTVRKILILLAFLQVIAWAFDIIENCMLLQWLRLSTVNTSLSLFHFFVYTKWLIALTGVITAVTYLIIYRRNSKKINRLSAVR